MLFIPNIETNSFILSFDDVEPFNENILIEAEAGFIQLDNQIEINVQLLGNVPIEILAYVLEVSKYCKMNILIPDDERGYSFLIDLKEQLKLKTQIRKK